jgi:hypothetical protein
VRGKLALADIDATTPVAVWLDAVYAAYAEAPHQVLEKLSKQLVIKGAMVDPEGARETWGQLPEHAAMAGKLGQGAGMEAGNTAGMPATQRPGAHRRPPIPSGPRPVVPGMPIPGKHPRRT